MDKNKALRDEVLYFLEVPPRFVCIFAIGKNIGFAPSSRREQQSTGLLRFNSSNLHVLFLQTKRTSFRMSFLFGGTAQI